MLLSLTQKYLEFLQTKATGVNILYIHSLYISNQSWHVILLMLTQARRNRSPPRPSLDFAKVDLLPIEIKSEKKEVAKR